MNEAHRIVYFFAKADLVQVVLRFGPGLLEMENYLAYF
jgi:hypothetical protein